MTGRSDALTKTDETISAPFPNGTLRLAKQSLIIGKIGKINCDHGGNGIGLRPGVTYVTGPADPLEKINNETPGSWMCFSSFQFLDSVSPTVYILKPYCPRGNAKFKRLLSYYSRSVTEVFEAQFRIKEKHVWHLDVN